MHVLLQLVDDLERELGVPADVQQEGELVDLEQVAVRSLTVSPTAQGTQPDNGGHLGGLWDLRTRKLSTANATNF